MSLVWWDILSGQEQLSCTSCPIRMHVCKTRPPLLCPPVPCRDRKPAERWDQHHLQFCCTLFWKMSNSLLWSLFSLTSPLSSSKDSSILEWSTVPLLVAATNSWQILFHLRLIRVTVDLFPLIILLYRQSLSLTPQFCNLSRRWSCSACPLAVAAASPSS